MRQYRGKTKDGEWLYGSLILSEDGSRAFIGHIRFWDDSMPVASYQEVIPATVGQSMGRKDTKRTKEYPEGQEIFERDILAESQHMLRSVVQWSDSDLAWSIGENWPKSQWYDNMEDEFEVINTIHDEDKKEINP